MHRSCALNFSCVDGFGIVSDDQLWVLDCFKCLEAGMPPRRTVSGVFFKITLVMCAVWYGTARHFAGYPREALIRCIRATRSTTQVIALLCTQLLSREADIVQGNVIIDCLLRRCCMFIAELRDRYKRVVKRLIIEMPSTHDLQTGAVIL